MSGRAYTVQPENGLRSLCLCAFVAMYSNILRIWFGSWATLLSDVVIVTLLFPLVNYRWNASKSRPINFVLIPAVLLIVLSSFEMVNINIQNHLYSLIEFRKTFFQMLAIFVGCAYCSTISNEHCAQRLIRFIALASIPLVIYGIKQFFFFDSFDSRLYSLMDSASDTSTYGTTTRAISFFSGPFHYGMFCVLIFASSIYLEKKTLRKSYLLLAALCLVGVFCSYTRTNMACALFVAAVAIFTPSAAKVNRAAARRLLAVLLVFAGVLLFVGGSGYVDLGNAQVNSLINSILDAGEDSRLSNRFLTWSQALELIGAHPLLGNGIGSAGDTLSAHSVASNWVTPHNAFLKVAVEMGIGGLILYLIFWGGVLSLCWRTTRRDPAGFGLFISIAVLLGVNMMLGSTLATFPVMTLVYLLLGTQCKVADLRSCAFGGDKA